LRVTDAGCKQSIFGPEFLIFRAIGLYQKLAERTAEILKEGSKSLADALKKASADISAGEVTCPGHFDL